MKRIFGGDASVLRRFARSCMAPTPVLAERTALLPMLAVFAYVLVACARDANSDGQRLPMTIRGVVRSEAGPVSDAIVQLQGTTVRTTSDSNGAFTLHGEGLGGRDAVTVTAWADEHFIGATRVAPGAGDERVEIALQPLFDKDNHTYNWFSFNGKSGSESCALCHREYAEWKLDAHAKASTNPRFVQLYRGTNAEGKRGQPTRLVAEGKAAPPDPALPDYGPGFKLDNADRAGNCAACHAPMSAKVETQNGCAWSGCHSTGTADRAEAAKAVRHTIRGISPMGVGSMAEEGVGCEFCHVVHSVRLDQHTQLPFGDSPGILSLNLRRPPEGQKLFFGTMTDANRAGVTHSPQMATSQACAACHYGVMGGVVSNMKMTGGVEVYNSYGEWLNSPYAEPQTGKTCQDCHMPDAGAGYSVPPEHGGVARPGYKYHSHKMAGADSKSLMWNALTLTGAAERNGDALRVSVSVTNDKTGHAVPTDAPIRSVMLVVEAFDAQGHPLALRDGPQLPDWAGDFSGRAGRAYAKILKDLWTGEAPTAAYWRQIELVEDTRIFPMKSDASDYVFAAPQGAATVKLKLIYRPAFYKLAQQKGWPNEDFVMAEQTIER